LSSHSRYLFSVAFSSATTANDAERQLLLLIFFFRRGSIGGDGGHERKRSLHATLYDHRSNVRSRSVHADYPQHIRAMLLRRAANVHCKSDYNSSITPYGRLNARPDVLVPFSRRSHNSRSQIRPPISNIWSAGEPRFRRRQEAEPEQAASNCRWLQTTTASLYDSHVGHQREHGTCAAGNEPAVHDGNSRRARLGRRRPHLASPVEAARLTPAPVRWPVDGRDNPGRALRSRHRVGLHVLVPLRRALRPVAVARRRCQCQDQWRRRSRWQQTAVG
jgi:hypothetical protein